MGNLTRRRNRWLKRSAVVLLIVCGGMTFGISRHDSAAFQEFAENVERWQVNPEFRSIALDYSIRGSAAMRTRPFFCPAKSLTMGVRSLPMLPKKYAVNPTSKLHYENFSRGPLSAYLHLCSEQDVPDMVGIVEAASRSANPTDDDLIRVLNGFQMDFPVSHDRGALNSVAAVLHDVARPKPFAIRFNIGPALAEPIRQLAAQLNVPANPDDMTADQQQAVLDRLDHYLRVHDDELWRTKQVSDLCGGIWAQVYGPPYNMLVVPILNLRSAATVLLFLLLAIFAMRRRRAMREINGISPQMDTDEHR